MLNVPVYTFNVAPGLKSGSNLNGHDAKARPVSWIASESKALGLLRLHPELVIKSGGRVFNSWVGKITVGVLPHSLDIWNGRSRRDPVHAGARDTSIVYCFRGNHNLEGRDNDPGRGIQHEHRGTKPYKDPRTENCRWHLSWYHFASCWIDPTESPASHHASEMGWCPHFPTKLQPPPASSARRHPS